MSREKRNKVLEIICLISEFVLKYGKLTNQTYLYIKRHNVLENLNKNYNMKQRIEFIDLAKGICMSLVDYLIISVIWYRLYRCFGTANSRCRIFHIG